MDSSNVVKVIAAFVAGIVVALGSALIYVRMTDIRQPAPTAETSVTVPSGPTELPEAGDVTKDQTPPVNAQPEAKPIAPQRPKTQVTPKHVVERHQPSWTVVPSKPVHKAPILVAQNRPIDNQVHPALHLPAPTVQADQAADTQPAPESVEQAPQPQPDMNVTTAPETPVAPPPALPQPHVVTLPVGTVLAVRLAETLSTDHNYTGDTFRATLLQRVIMDGFIIADKGSKVLGRVVNAQSAGHMANVAGLSLAITEINTTDGQRVHVQTNVYDCKGNSNVGPDAAKIAGGAALGAIIGGAAGGGKGAAIGAGVGGAAGTGAVLLTHGKPAVVENETQPTFRLASPVTITEKLN